MNVLLVNGSPHQSGCTYTALREVEDALNQAGIGTEIFWIGNRPISGCIACGACVKSGSCIHTEIVGEFLDRAEQTDGFVFGSPVHYAAVAGGMTAFMDCVFFSAASAARPVFRYKPAAAVLSARRAGTTAAWDQMNKYFGITEMPIVSSRYWNMVHGNTPEEVRQDLEGLQTMRMLGRNMAYLLKCREAGERAGVRLPEQEEHIVHTNFVRE